MGKYILQIVIGIGTFAWGKWFASDNLQPELYGITIGIGIVLIIALITFIINERALIGVYLNCFLFKRNEELRLSIAYLFKIEVQGKYLLVRNSRFNSTTYQPVGGVYKYYHPEATKTLCDMSIIPDNDIGNDDISEYDLRLRMRERKNIRSFIQWFFSKCDRELDPWREFYEELVATKILPSKDFKYIHYDLVGQHFEPIHRDEHFKVDTFKYVDIYTPKFINQKQRDKLKQLLSDSNPDFIWVTEAEINCKRSNDGKRISDHAYKIFHTKKLR